MARIVAPPGRFAAGPMHFVGIAAKKVLDLLAFRLDSLWPAA